MLKLKLSKSDWEKLEPAVQELYEADGDDYVPRSRRTTARTWGR
jgi:hypothetical protein